MNAAGLVGAGSSAVVVCENLGPSTAANVSCGVEVRNENNEIVPLVSDSCAGDMSVLASGAERVCYVSYSQAVFGAYTQVNASVSTSTADDDMSNNASSGRVNVVLVADMVGVGIFAQGGGSAPAKVYGGDTQRFELRCRNDGPSQATDVHCELGGVLGSYMPGASGSCTVGGVPVSYPVGSLGSGAVVACVVDVSIPASGGLSLGLSVKASAAEADAVVGNNTNSSYACLSF